jgi:hypothetical protein
MKRRKIVRRKNIYDVDWWRGDWCYRTTTGCDWEAVLECKRAAKLMGEKITYEKTGVKEDVYYTGGRGGSPRFIAR